MDLSYATIQGICERFGWEACGQYGEPGYKLQEDKLTPLVVFGNYWCHCDKFGEDQPGRNVLHDTHRHWPKVFEKMEAQGVEFEWNDEWVVDYDNDKAYRCSPDSYQWQQAFRWTDHGDMLTPDDDIQEWIDEIVNNPQKCFPSDTFSDAQLNEAGFTEYQCGYENGWFPGQTADPKEISKIITSEYEEQDKEVDILYKLSYVSQFDLGFCVFVRERKDAED